MREHAERFDTEIVMDHINEVDFSAPPAAAQGRPRRLHLRRADHRHRRERALPRPRVRAGLPRPRRLGLRDLRRLLLPRPARRRDRRRQHGRRGSAVPVEHRLARHAGAPPRQAALARRSCRTACSSGRTRRRGRHRLEPRGRGSARRRLGRHGRARRGRPTARARATSRSPACSSPSATRRTRRSSRASST